MKGLCKHIVFGFFVFLCIFLLALFLLNKREGKVLCNESEEGYEIVLYDSWGNVVDTTWSPVEPVICNVTDELVEIVISVGSPAHYIFYFDKRNNMVSDTFFNPILIDNRYIATYEEYESEKKVIIRDLFDENEFYMEVIRDFSPGTIMFFNSTVSIEVLDKKNFLIEYLEGEDYKTVKEIIPINS